MEATTIDQLFPDVLEEIFSHLSGNDLKNCALVCKDWNDVIGSYATTMKKMKIGFGLDRDHISIERFFHEGIKMQSSDVTCRKYRNVEISIDDGSLTQLPNLDQHFNTSQVRSLILRFWSSGIELNKVAELLSRMPLLQVLTIIFYHKSTLDPSNAPVAHLPKLKHLNLHLGYGGQPITAILEFFKADNLTELTYRDRAEHSKAEIATVADFIKSKKSLTKLDVSSRLFAHLHRRHNFSGMNLESLKVYAGKRAAQSDIVNKNFRKSLISNAHSLTSLSIPSWLMSKEVLVVIFKRLRKLETLEIDSRDDSWMENLMTNNISKNLSLKTLKVFDVGAIDGLKAILQRAPQLKKLSLGLVTEVIMKEVTTSAPKLVELAIDSLEENLSGAQRFNELKSLKIRSIANVGILASLLERCPQIEAFECFYYAFPNVDANDLIDILLQQKTLKHLRFGCSIPAANRIIFDKLKTNFGNLRSLELGYHFKFILFDFSKNPAEWNVARQEARFSAFHDE